MNTPTPTPRTAGITDWQPAILPWGKAAGAKVERISYSPSEGIYACNDEGCTYIAVEFKSVFAHLGSHTPRGQGKRRSASVDRQIAALETALTHLKEAVADARDLGVDGSWRERALTAERRLATLRNALKK